MLTQKIISTPIGKLLAVFSSTALVKLSFFNLESSNLPENTQEISRQLEKELMAYFLGKIDHFNIQINLKGTPFQQSVWQGLTHIPYGKTWSYSDLANHINNPKAVRTVGSAARVNPIPIIIPCHRLIQKNGNIGNYAGGTDIKTRLLNLEKQQSLI